MTEDVNHISALFLYFCNIHCSLVDWHGVKMEFLFFFSKFASSAFVKNITKDLGCEIFGVKDSSVLVLMSHISWHV